MRLKLLAVPLCAAALLVACRGGNDGPVPVSATPTTTDLASTEIARYTLETAQPLDLNTAAISDADTDDAASPIAVN